MRLRPFERSPSIDYIRTKDRHIFKRPDALFKFNIVGTGMIGQEHMRVTELEGRAQIHGIYDRQPESVQVAQREFVKYCDRDIVVHSSLEAACNDPNADALIICTPNHTHLDVLKIAIQSCKPILLEKPMATTCADALEICKIADDYAAPIQIGLQYRYKPIYNEAIYEALERKSLGDMKTISISEYRPPFLDKVDQWNKFSDKSGGTLVEKCCHYFDLITLFAGAKPIRVFASGSQAINFKGFSHEGQTSDILDNATVIIDYEGGTRGTFTLNMFCPNFQEELVICGDQGRLSAKEKADIQSETPLSCDMLIEKPEPGLSRRITPHYARFIEDSGHSGATYMEHIAFVDTMRGEQTNAAKVLDGLWSVVVGAAAERSVKTGMPVTIAEFAAETEGLPALLGLEA